MIFKPELARKVAAGTKTMTRRRINPNGVRYHEGRWYKVQPGRGKFHICHIFVDEVREQLLGGISETDARREGFGNRNDLIAYWKLINGDWDPAERVAVIGWDDQSALVEPCCAELPA